MNLRMGKSPGNPLPCSTALCIRDVMGGSQRTEDVNIFCGDSLDFDLDTTHCGKYEVTVPRAVFADFLGFFAFRARRPETFFVSVDPLPERPEPEPDFSRFIPLRFFPRPGGGFSENYELKEYIPGDPLNTIHWKLSAKTDQLVVRQPQDPEEIRIYLTLDLVADRNEMDQALGCLVWVGRKLLELDLAFNVCTIFDGKGIPESLTVGSFRDMEELLDRILGSPATPASQSLAEMPIPGANWRFHVNPRKEGKDE